ncbi:MAG TPA: hypothetical protein VGK67_34670 [Myxococcales bacterium]|jgi:hypothetical protein
MLNRLAVSAVLLSALGCSTCAKGGSAFDPAEPRPEEVLPLSSLCAGPCDDYQRSRALAVEHTRKGMAADDPFAFSATDTCDALPRIESWYGEHGALRELYFSGGTLVAAYEKPGKGAGRWFGRYVRNWAPGDGEGPGESLCGDERSLRAEAAAALEHRRGVLVFRAGPLGWGRLQATVDGAETGAGAGWLRDTRTRTVPAGSSGSLTVVQGADSPDEIRATFRYSLAANLEDSRLVLVETSPATVAVDLERKAWRKGAEQPLAVIRFEAQRWPITASMERLPAIQLKLGDKWAAFYAAYHPILE